jgi:hypothetical protein
VSWPGTAIVWAPAISVSPRTRPSRVPDRIGGLNQDGGTWKWSSVARDQSEPCTSSSCDVLAIVSSFSIRPDRRKLK